MNEDEIAKDSKKRPRGEPEDQTGVDRDPSARQRYGHRRAGSSNQHGADASSSSDGSNGLVLDNQHHNHTSQTQQVPIDPSFQGQWLAHVLNQPQQQQSASVHQVSSSSSAFEQTSRTSRPHAQQLLESIQALLANQQRQGSSNHGTTFQNTLAGPALAMSLQQQQPPTNNPYITQALQALLLQGQGQNPQSSWQQHPPVPPPLPPFGLPALEVPTNLQTLLATLNARQTASAAPAMPPPQPPAPTAPSLDAVLRQFAASQHNGDSTTRTNTASFISVPVPPPPPPAPAEGSSLLNSLMILLANQRQQQEQQEQHRQQQQQQQQQQDQNLLYRQLALAAVAQQHQQQQQQQPQPALTPLQLQLLTMALSSANQPQPQPQSPQQVPLFASLPSPLPPHTISVPNMGGSLLRSGSSSSDPIVKDLSQPNDKVMLSRYQVCIRHQLELFTANEMDAQTIVQGRKRAVRVNQVGLRCRHCYQLPLSVRARGAVYYPKQIAGIYQAALNMASSHLLEACESVPPEIRDEIRNLRDRHETRIGGKSYWNECCVSQGLVERDEALWF